jgi:protein scribble
MTEARHDHAVSLLTAASPTIALLLERETEGSLPLTPSPHASPIPTATAATTTTVTPGEPGLPRLAPSLLAAALEGPYPVEVRHLPTACLASTLGRKQCIILPCVPALQSMV